jgi:hypothetical protein
MLPGLHCSRIVLSAQPSLQPSLARPPALSDPTRKSAPSPVARPAKIPSKARWSPSVGGVHGGHAAAGQPPGRARPNSSGSAPIKGGRPGPPHTRPRPSALRAAESRLVPPSGRASRAAASLLRAPRRSPPHRHSATEDAAAALQDQLARATGAPSPGRPTIRSWQELLCTGSKEEEDPAFFSKVPAFSYNF